jgi:transposase-like protein
MLDKLKVIKHAAGEKVIDHRLSFWLLKRLERNNTMVYQQKNNLYQAVLDLITEEGANGFKEVLKLLVNAAMVEEREKYLGVASYERSEDRLGYANGFKPKTLNTRVGSLELQIPQTRDCKFYPQSLEKGKRSERALGLAIVQMYVQGVSTRNVEEITKQLCGFEISSSTVSKLVAELDPLLKEWRERPLNKYKYVYLDARYEKVRHGGLVVDQAVFTAAGVNDDGQREMLGTSVSLSEAEVHWRQFLSQLQKRGLHGIELFISDDHTGLKAARKAVFPGIPWQRCQVHLQRNAQKYVPKEAMKGQVAADIRAIFNAPDRVEADRLLKKTMTTYEKSAPKLSSWLEENIAEGLTIFSFPAQHRTKIRTTNMIERLNREIKRRTQVVSIFPNEDSCLRLVTAIVMEMSEEWLTERQRYMPKLKETDTG